MITIYKIYSTKGPNVYVGSTSYELHKRKINHLSAYKKNVSRCSSIIMFAEYGVENCIFETIEMCEEEVRYERERFWIESISTVNKNKRPSITDEEKETYRKEKVLCDCGCKIRRSIFARHLTTEKHLEKIKKISI
jgi:hypothetical protein